jgi:hypothetical protein
METDWRDRLILSQLSAGATLREAAGAAGITKQGLAWRCRYLPGLAEAVRTAREAGAEERKYRLWLRHPFRGKRPPTGKGHGGKPRFSYGRRGGA